MKRSRAPSIVDAAKRQRDEEANAAAAAALAAAPPDDELVGRTLRHREGRAAADAKPAGPTRDYIDITGKKPKKKGRPSKKNGEEEGEDDEDDTPTKTADTPENTPVSEPSAAGDKENAIIEDADGDLPLDARPPKRKASEAEAAYFLIVYHQVNTRRERETHDGILRVCGKNATLLNFKTGREVTSTTEVGIDVLEGMAVRMNKRDMDVGTKFNEQEFDSGIVFLKKAPTQQALAAQAAAKAALPSWIQKYAMPGTMVRPTMRKSMLAGRAGFVVPLKGREKPEDLSIPKFDPDTPGAVILYRPLSKIDRNGKFLVPIVIDLDLGRKLRPHQKDGVKFLFDCMIGKNINGGVYKGAILADEMGLGKTCQAVTLAYTLLHQGVNGEPTVRKAIIVSPSSLVRNWCKEFDKWLVHLAMYKKREPKKKKKVNLYERQNKRKKKQEEEEEESSEEEEEEELPPLDPNVPRPFVPRVVAISENSKAGKRALLEFEAPREREGADVLCISYDQFRIFAPSLTKIPDVDLLICDEGHRIKNDKIKTTQVLNSLPTRRRIILSGTPIQNDLDEFYSMVNFVNPGILDTPEKFNRIWATPIITGRDPNASDEEKEIGRKRSEALSELTARFILRRTADLNAAYLPTKIEFVVFCRLSEPQAEMYKGICEGLKTVRPDNSEGDKEGVEKPRGPGGNQTLRCITALKKLCNHPELIYRVYQEEEGNRDLIQPVIHHLAPYGAFSKPMPELSGKMQFLATLLVQMRDTTGDRIVVVSNYTQTLDLLEKLCKELHIGYFRLDGDTAVQKRQKLVDEFNEHKDKLVFFLSSKAGGVGLNLVGANRLVLFDPDWNPAADLQAMARVWRDGQKKQVYIYRLLSTGTIEEKIFQRQVTKQGLSNTIVDEKTTVRSLFGSDDLKNLFSYNPATKSETHDLLRCTTCNADKLSRRELYARRKKTGMEALENWDHHQEFKTADDELLQNSGQELVTFVFSNLEKGELVVKQDK